MVSTSHETIWKSINNLTAGIPTGNDMFASSPALRPLGMKLSLRRLGLADRSSPQCKRLIAKSLVALA